MKDEDSNASDVPAKEIGDESLLMIFEEIPLLSDIQSESIIQLFLRNSRWSKTIISRLPLYKPPHEV